MTELMNCDPLDKEVWISVVNSPCIKSFGSSENLRSKNVQIDTASNARYCAAMGQVAPLALAGAIMRKLVARVLSTSTELLLAMAQMVALHVRMTELTPVFHAKKSRPGPG